MTQSYYELPAVLLYVETTKQDDTELLFWYHEFVYQMHEEFTFGIVVVDERMTTQRRNQLDEFFVNELEENGFECSIIPSYCILRIPSLVIRLDNYTATSSGETEDEDEDVMVRATREKPVYNWRKLASRARLVSQWKKGVVNELKDHKRRRCCDPTSGALEQQAGTLEQPCGSIFILLRRRN
jgi:hypothetical protein